MTGLKFSSFWMFPLIMILVVATGLAMRVPRLDQRPMHTDEAVHAFKLGILLESSSYTYDPHEYHGPTMYYSTLPILWLCGYSSYVEIPSEIPMRLVSAFYGAGLILLLFFVRDGFGKTAVICAGLFTAFSPAMVFYSRYYIMEILLVFFTFAAIVSGWRYYCTKKMCWALLTGLFFGLMHATKETCIIAWCAMFGAIVLTYFFTKVIDKEEHIEGEAPPTLIKHFLIAAVVAIVVSVLCNTALLTNPRAAIDSVLTYKRYVSRASTAGASEIHRHPWYYYLKMLIYTKNEPGPWWSEGLILVLALFGIGSSLMRKAGNRHRVSLLRFITFYTLLMTFAYSIIPYKTPWCMLGFLHGYILLAGVGVAAIMRLLPNRYTRVMAALLLAAGLYQLSGQACSAAFKFDADTRNPYVYGHTARDFNNLVKSVNNIAEVHPDKKDMVIKVIAAGSDYWPIPWYLREFRNKGYWTSVPDDPDAPLIIATLEMDEKLKEKLQEEYLEEFYGLRRDVLMKLYIRRDLWDVFLEKISK